MSWENQKENIQPLPQGRKIDALFSALSLVTDNKARSESLKARKEQFDKDLEQIKDDPNAQLDLWHEYIDWIEQNVPESGKVTGLSTAIEECIEIYYNKKEFKQDERLFDIFMKFKQFCDEPVEVFGFMYANSIATLLANFYLNWSWQYEIRKNISRAEDLIMLGLKNLASPREVLEEARTQIKFRIERMINAGMLDECPNSAPSSYRQIQADLANEGIRAALQTLKFRANKRQGLVVPVNRTGISVDAANVGGLKSQTKIVNGVKVAKKLLKPKSNRPITVLPENENENPRDENQVGHENARPLRIMDKIATSQRIQLVGRSGHENNAPKRATLATANKPPVWRDE